MKARKNSNLGNEIENDYYLRQLDCSFTFKYLINGRHKCSAAPRFSFFRLIVNISFWYKLASLNDLQGKDLTRDDVGPAEEPRSHFVFLSWIYVVRAFVFTFVATLLVFICTSCVNVSCKGQGQKLHGWKWTKSRTWEVLQNSSHLIIDYFERICLFWFIY